MYEHFLSIFYYIKRFIFYEKNLPVVQTLSLVLCVLHIIYYFMQISLSLSLSLSVSLSLSLSPAVRHNIVRPSPSQSSLIVHVITLNFRNSSFIINYLIILLTIRRHIIGSEHEGFRSLNQPDGRSPPLYELDGLSGDD